jgi:hypothetical protein
MVLRRLFGWFRIIPTVPRAVRDVNDPVLTKRAALLSPLPVAHFCANGERESARHIAFYCPMTT